MRKTQRINMLELELYKLRIELDLIHEILSGLLSENKPQQNMESGKWYPRRLPPQQ
ncbi:MAG: hypothetical protein RLZZ195_907 [Pseudomonadota bacterium]|jgi:hypothetical protein